MIIKIDKIFLIVSKDEKLIAKGSPRNRYICHVDEKTNKRLLTYRSKSVATNAFTNSGFWLSQDAREYIQENYPQVISSRFGTRWTESIADLFQAKEFDVIYESK